MDRRPVSRIFFEVFRMRFTHDCDKCKPLGQATHGEYDLYYCDEVVPTVIARYGNEGSHYMSGMELTLEPLMEAKQLAMKAGFIAGKKLEV